MYFFFFIFTSKCIWNEPLSRVYSLTLFCAFHANGRRPSPGRTNQWICVAEIELTLTTMKEEDTIPWKERKKEKKGRDVSLTSEREKLFQCFKSSLGIVILMVHEAPSAVVRSPRRIRSRPFFPFLNKQQCAHDTSLLFFALCLCDRKSNMLKYPCSSPPLPHPYPPSLYPPFPPFA